MSEPEVIYRTKLPDNKLPYYRLTTFMNELFTEPDLMRWFDWINDKGIPCVVAMGTDERNFGKLAVWVWGDEHSEWPESKNVETMGRTVIESQNWAAVVEGTISLVTCPIEKGNSPPVVVEQLNLFEDH